MPKLPTLNDVAIAAWVLGCLLAALLVAAVLVAVIRAGARPAVQVAALLDRAPAPTSEGRHAADETDTWMLSQPWDGDEPYRGRHWAPDVEHTGQYPTLDLGAHMAGAA